MSKINLQDVQSLTDEQSALDRINQNSAVIETASDTFLSRDGTSPNEMTAALDMNSNRIINLPTPTNGSEPLRLNDLPQVAEGNLVIGMEVGTSNVLNGVTGHILNDNNGILGELPTTGSGSVVLNTSPTLVTPALGTPSSATLTSATGLPISTGVSGLGTGVATALATNTGSAGAPVLFNGAGGTPTSLTLTNATGLPVAGGGTGATTAAGARTNLALTREALSADRTYFVRTDGNDSNTGLVNNAGGAFLTIQKAVDVVWDTIDQNGHVVTIQVADGTYTGSVTRFGSAVGGIPQITGNTTTPANCLISCTAPAVSCFDFRREAQVYIKGFKITTITSGRGIHSSSSAYVEVNGNFDFGACVDGQACGEHLGTLGLSANYTISGGGAWHIRAVAGGIVNIGGIATTLTGTPAFTTAFAHAWMEGSIQNNSTYSGSATGPQYLAQDGTVNTANTLPGNSAGLIYGSGNYNDLTQATRLCSIITGVNFNSANTDNAMAIILPPGRTRYQVGSIRLFNASASISTATMGIFTSTGGGGATILSAGTAITVTTSAENTAGNGQALNPTNTGETYNATTIYFRVGTAQGSAATASVMVEYVTIP